jgi:hypothetical protein
MLEEQVLAALRAAFGTIVWERTQAAELAVRFPAAHPAVGDTVFVVERDEVTIHIGSITHGHFNRFDLPPDARPGAIAADVVDFLAALFSDRVVVWSRRMSGGWTLVAPGEQPSAVANAATYVWSGPIR